MTQVGEVLSCASESHQMVSFHLKTIQTTNTFHCVRQMKTKMIPQFANAMDREKVYIKGTKPIILHQTQSTGKQQKWDCQSSSMMKLSQGITSNHLFGENHHHLLLRLHTTPLSQQSWWDFFFFISNFSNFSSRKVTNNPKVVRRSQHC